MTIYFVLNAMLCFIPVSIDTETNLFCLLSIQFLKKINEILSTETHFYMKFQKKIHYLGLVVLVRT